MENFDSKDSTPQIAESEKNRLETKYNGRIFPNLITRVKAVFIDLVVLLIIFTCATLFIDMFGDIPNFVKASIAIFMFYLYDPILTSFTGSTLGHKVMKLKVRRYNDPEKRISFGQAFLRFITKGFLGWLSFLTVTGNKRKRAIHDIASGSIIMTVK